MFMHSSTVQCIWNYSFYGRGDSGPELFLTDDSAAERAALKAVWPESTLMLCIFHYLQAWWSWLWDKKQNIAKADRQPIMQLVKGMLFTHSESSLSKRYDGLIKSAGESDSYVYKYPHVLTRFQNFWERRHEWALSYRVNKPMRNNHTNNYAEAGIRVLKEIIFGRVKSYNLIQMFDFIITLMEKYYVNRLLDIAHSRYRPGIALKFRQLQKLTNTITDIEQHSQSIYCVTEWVSDINFDFLVDIEIWPLTLEIRYFHK